nr:FG-GAP-like repeat-containing protein [uncultured Draconibacterium sp.]
MKLLYTILIMFVGIGSVLSQEFDLTITSTDAGTKTYQARNSITFGNNYSYTPNGGTLTAEIVDPIVSGTIPYSSTVDPMNRTLNTSYLVGATQGTFNVNALGGATYTIPLQLPDGVGGFAPSLSLTYSSNGGNGIAGYGWNIGGLSVITRGPQTYYHDEKSVGVDLTSTDRFFLDGQRLICTSGSYGADNSEYRTEIDNFTRVKCMTVGTSSPKRFTAETKSGVDIQYGWDLDSDQMIDGLDEEVSWYINKMTDLYGNTIEFEYLRQHGNNYIGEIKYGPNTVTFYYKERSDKRTSYFVGGTLEQNLILDKIEMKYNSTLVKKYDLKYNYHYTTPYYGSYSVLNEVIEYGANNSRYNSTAFSYEYPTGSCDNYPYLNYNSYISTDYIQYPGDFNGDGRTDIFTVKESDLKSWRLYLATEYGGLNYSASGTVGNRIDGAVISDLNADGMDDIVTMHVIGTQLEYYWKLSTGSSFGLSYRFAVHQAGSLFYTDFYDFYENFQKNRSENSSDFDGDGFNDFAVIDKINKSWSLYSFTPSSNNVSFLNNNRSGTVTSWGDEFQIADFNGDGKADIWTFDSSGMKVYSYNGSTMNQIYSGSYPNKNHLFKLGDFNGDGKTDIFVYGSGSYEWSQWQFRLSTGTGLIAKYFTKKKTDLKSDVVYTGDFNGDGRTDILALSKNSSNNPRQYYFITRPNATDMTSEYYERSEYNKDYQFTLGDYDGNGKTDIIVTSASNSYRRGKITGNTNILLSRFADGLNNTGALSYRKLSGEYSNYEKGTANDDFPVFTYMGPLTVVSDYWTNGGSSLNQDYSYTGLKIHRQGKGSLGFEQMVVEDSHWDTKTETNSSYDGTYFYPTILSTKNYVDGAKISETKNTWSKQVTKYVTGLDPIFPFINYHMNRNVLKGQQDSTTYTYDSTIKGSLKEAKQKFDNGVTKTTTNTYYSNDETNWYIGRIQESIVKYEKSGETTQSNKTTYTYYTDGKLKPDFIRYNVGTNWEYSVNHDYYSNGNLKQTYQQSSGLGSLDTDYEYETNGIRLKKVTDPLRLVTNYIYDTYGRLQKETDHRGNETTFTYDNMGRQATQTEPDGFVSTTAYNWGSDGVLTNEVYTVTTSGNDGSQAKTWYDKEGKELRTDVKSFGNTIYSNTGYDTKGRLSKKYEPATSTALPSDYTLYEYDTKNRVNKITTAGGKVTNISYPGNQVTKTSEGLTSWKETDSQGLLTTASDFGGEIDYTYYPNGQVKSINHPGGTTSMKYDLAGNQTELNDPDAGITSYEYNAYGQIKKQTNAAGDITNYTYTSDGLLDKHVTGSETTDYTYDAYKQLTNISSPGSVSRTYSYATTGVKGRLTGIAENIAGTNFSTTFEYDGVGRMYKRTHPSGVVEENVYDSNSGLLEKVKAGTTVVWDIDAMNEYGQIKSAKYGTNLTATMNYDMGLPDNATIGSIYSYDYEFDPKFGWPNYRKNMKHGVLTENFGYENLRLDSIWGNTSNGFGYENSGNITRKNDLGLMEYDGYQITDLYAKTSSLVPVNTQSINYTWFQQIENISEGNYSASFTYNSDQQRCKMVVSQNGSTLYTRWYPGSQYMKEVRGSTTTQYTWLGGDAYSAPAVSVKIGTGTPVIYYVLRDYLGSITHVVKSTDLTNKEYSFDAWGRRRSANDWNYTLDGSDQPLFAGRGFTGHEHIPEFGLINMNGRLYDPLLGRMLSPDNYVQLPDFSQSFNRYSYAFNNPLIYIDPDGEWAILDDLGVMFIGGTINWATHGFKFNKEGLGYFGVGALSAEATLYGGPLAGAAVLGAGNDITQQVAQNGWKNINLWQTVDATAMSMATSYLGGQLSQKFAPQFSKLASRITGSLVFQQGLTDGLTYASTGFVLTTGMTMLSGEDLETSLKAGRENALTSFGMGFMNGSISGYRYSRKYNLDPWTGEKLHGHHSDPIFMGGNIDQDLTRMRASKHRKLHGDMNDFLFDQRDAYGNHMRPQRNNSGTDIQQYFSRQQRINALKLFYDNNKLSYPRARYDFYRNNGIKWRLW